jgi:hypothetical protein
MTEKECLKYYLPAFKNVTGRAEPYSATHIIDFGTIALSDPIGFDPWPSPYSPPLTKRDLDRLVLLAGPHGKTIFEILKIQKGEK